MVVNLTPEQIQAILTKHHQKQAEIKAQDLELERQKQLRADAWRRLKADMPKVTLKKQQTCPCGATIPQGAQAIMRKKQVNLSGNRGYTPAFRSEYLCGKCTEEMLK